jgi:predicted transcriptional regulator
MGTRDNPVTVYLTDEEKAKLKQWSEKTGKSVSDLSREAILEYTDRDRVERIESEIKELHDKMDRVLTQVGEQHTHTRQSTKTMSVPETAREIAKRIYSNHEMPVSNQDVELAIEDIGGADDRTIQKYKNQLKKRGLLYKHPVSAVWTDEKEEFIQWAENATVNTDVHEVTKEYAMSTTEYTQIAETL